MKEISAGDVLTRLAQLLDCKNDTELADALKVKKTTLYTWRHRNTVPFDECVKVADDLGVTLDYILFGIPPKERAAEYKKTKTSGTDFDSIEGQRERQLEQIKKINQWLNQAATDQGRTLSDDQRQAFNDFAFLYNLNEPAVRRLLVLCDYVRNNEDQA